MFGSALEKSEQGDDLLNNGVFQNVGLLTNLVWNLTVQQNLSKARHSDVYGTAPRYRKRHASGLQAFNLPATHKLSAKGVAAC